MLSKLRNILKDFFPGFPRPFSLSCIYIPHSQRFYDCFLSDKFIETETT